MLLHQAGKVLQPKHMVVVWVQNMSAVGVGSVRRAGLNLPLQYHWVYQAGSADHVGSPEFAPFGFRTTTRADTCTLEKWIAL
jgi:hypothetical protein